MKSIKKSFAPLIGAALAAGPILAAQAQDIKPPRISSYAQLDYYNADAGTVATAPEQLFTVRRARLYVSGDAGTPMIGYTLGAALDDSGAGARSAQLWDAIVDLRFSPLATVRVGSYKYEFDMVGRSSASDLPFINRPTAAVAVAGGMTGAVDAAGLPSLTNFRDKGVSLLGSTKEFGYAVGLYQGQGNNAGDNNSKFGYTANGWVKLMGVKLNLGYLNSDNTASGSPATNKNDAWTAGLEYTTGPVYLRGEYYTAKRKTPTVTRDRKGFYAEGVYFFNPSIDFALRYQRYQQEEVWGTTANKISGVDVGMAYYFVRRGSFGGTKLLLNFMTRDADAGVRQSLFGERGTAIQGDNIGNGFLARLQVQY